MFLVCVCVHVCVIVPNPLLNGALMRLYQAALLLSSLEGCGFVFCESLTLLHTHTLSNTHTHTHICAASAETTGSAQCVTRAQKMWAFPARRQLTNTEGGEREKEERGQR